MFKIGDKVRVVSDDESYYKDRFNLIDEVGEVVKVSSDGNCFVKFRLYTQLDEYVYYAHELQKVEDKMFKKGMVIVNESYERLILAECDGYYGLSSHGLDESYIYCWWSEKSLIERGYKPKQEEVIEMTVEEVTKMVVEKEGRDVVVKIKK